MTTTTSSAPDEVELEPLILDLEERRARVARELAAMPGLRELLVELDLYEDLELELDRCIPPLWITPAPSRALRRKHGIEFSPAEVERFLRFCIRLRHIEGKLAGRPLVPDLWQVVYIIAPVFGWRQADGNRYYRELFLEVPRKNGKSTLSAAIALFLLMADSNLKAGRLYEPGAQIYTAATTRDQGLKVFRPAELMAKGSPSISGRLGIVTDKALVYEQTLSRLEVIAGEPARAEEKMGGNSSGNIIDETHVHKDARLIETMESATVSREQPLTAHLTTAGADVEGTIYAEKHDLAVAIAQGKVTELRTWAVIYTITAELEDRWDDPEVWQAANPGLGISVGLEYLEDKAIKARRSERVRLAFLRLHLNVRTSTVSRWTNMDLFSIGAAHLPAAWPELRGMVAFGGLDLSSALDLTAAGFVIPRWVPDPNDPGFEIEVLEVLMRAWTPLDGLRSRPPAERELFTKWIKEGWLLASPGMTIDYDAVEAELYKLADTLEVERLSFDRWGSKAIANHLSDGGLRIAEVGQGFAGISAAMKETEKIIAEGRLWTGGNPLVRYAFENLAVETDAAGNIKPNRAKSTGRIDPAVTIIMAVDGYMRTISTESAYEERGLATA